MTRSTAGAVADIPSLGAGALDEIRRVLGDVGLGLAGA
jgi:hypothetical protein